ncbi:helix-turn-helix transcriptional regulator [Allomuricauda sp. CP2A]|jgi:AraC-like DNA-binding protein|uniref:helix-turn-helix transcriptional regulator n=1 Tax=Allomuricauda sp. CP2A TaxID=1848189 RepID=UPI0008336B34|nr:helix-turn-helix transcriptional regulator [Muricauda sp. CP2A]
MNVKFSEYRPSPALGSYVQAFYTGDFNLYSENNFVQSVVPNGCIELIIHLTHDHCELVKEDTWGKSPEFTLIGLQTKPYEVRFNEQVQIFGVRFNPEGIYHIFGVPPALFTATFENSTDVLGNEFKDYCSRLRESTNIQQRIRLTEAFLLKNMLDNAKGYDYVRMASEIIRKSHGLLSLEELIQKVHISPRQLQREFKKKFGITAKEYMRLSRLNAVQQYMQVPNSINLTEVSYEHGFADQSHFIREFKKLAGTNPRSFLKKRADYLTLPVNLE